MKGHRVNLCMYFRASLSEPVERRHVEVTRNMQVIDPPLGWNALEAPPRPEFGDKLIAIYRPRYPIPGVSSIGTYEYRGDGTHWRDGISYDDHLFIEFSTSNRHVEYAATVREQFPKLIAAFRSHRAAVSFDIYNVKYEGGVKDTNPIYNQLRQNPSIDINGRNNIFTLEPAHYWDALLCQRALGYDRDEVIRRLDGKVPLVMPLMDGVYTVFSDDPNLSYEEFVALNDRFKPILGLI